MTTFFFDLPFRGPEHRPFEGDPLDLKALTEVPWDRAYLLGWHEDDRWHLTTWDGHGREEVDFLVVGTSQPPMWAAPVLQGSHVYLMPDDLLERAKLIRRGGFHAIGWLFDEPFLPRRREDLPKATQ